MLIKEQIPHMILLGQGKHIELTKNAVTFLSILKLPYSRIYISGDPSIGSLSTT